MSEKFETPEESIAKHLRKRRLEKMKRHPFTFQLTAQEFVHLCNAASDLNNKTLDIKLLEGALDSLSEEALNEVRILRKGAKAS